MVLGGAVLEAGGEDGVEEEQEKLSIADYQDKDQTKDEQPRLIFSLFFSSYDILY